MKNSIETQRDSLLAELAMLRAKTPDTKYVQARVKWLRDVAHTLPMREATTQGNVTMRQFLEQEAQNWETNPDVMRAKVIASLERALIAVDDELKEASRGS